MKLSVTVSAALVAGTLLVSTCSSAAWSQEKADAEKTAAIKQLLETMHAVENAQLGMDLMFKQQVTGFNAGVSQKIDSDTTLTAEQKTQKKEEITHSMDKMLNRLHELIDEKMGLPELVSVTYGKLYGNYFTTPEILEMAKCYASPVGQKSLKIQPKITQEALQEMNPVVFAKMKDINQQVEAEAKEGKL